MNSEAFFNRVAARTACDEPTEVERVTRTVLATFGECLERSGAAVLAEQLPEELGVLLNKSEHREGYDLVQLTERVASRLEVRTSVAIEQVVSVLLALAESVSDQVLALVRLTLPENIARLLAPIEPLGAPATAHLDPSRHDLAEGRPGAANCLSSGRPSGAQGESIARAGNPHRETKLSSATGLTQEREGRSLASHRPSQRSR